MKMSRFLPVLFVSIVCGAVRAQNQVSVADDADRKDFVSDCSAGKYVITNAGPDTSIKIWRWNGNEWLHIATLGVGDDHEVTCDADDKLAAQDANDSDEDGATVTWTSP